MSLTGCLARGTLFSFNGATFQVLEKLKDTSYRTSFSDNEEDYEINSTQYFYETGNHYESYDDSLQSPPYYETYSVQRVPPTKPKRTKNAKLKSQSHQSQQQQQQRYCLRLLHVPEMSVPTASTISHHYTQQQRQSGDDDYDDDGEDDDYCIVNTNRNKKSKSDKRVKVVATDGDEDGNDDDSESESDDSDDSDDDLEDLLIKEYSILKLIKRHPFTLQCEGKCSVVDRFNQQRDCLIFSHMDDSLDSLSDYVDAHRFSLNFGGLVHLSATIISAFVCFDYENIVWHSPISLRNFGYYSGLGQTSVNSTNIGVVGNSSGVGGGACITSGFQFCEVQPLPQEEEDEELIAIYKKNCAQIKAIVFGVLTRSARLVHASAQPGNLTELVEPNIVDTNLFEYIESFPKFHDIFVDHTLVTLIDFIQHLASLTLTPPVEQNSQESTSKTSSQSPSTTQSSSFQHNNTSIQSHNPFHSQIDIEMTEGIFSELQMQSNNMPNNNIFPSTHQKKYLLVKEGNQKEGFRVNDENPVEEEEEEKKNNESGNNPARISYKAKSIRLQEEEKENEYVFDFFEGNSKPTTTTHAEQLYAGEEVEQPVGTFNFFGQIKKPKTIGAVAPVVAAAAARECSWQEKQILSLDQSISYSLTNSFLPGSPHSPGSTSMPTTMTEINFDDSDAKQENPKKKRGNQRKVSNIDSSILIEDEAALISGRMVVRILMLVVVLFLIGGVIFGVYFDFGVRSSASNESDPILIDCADSNCLRCDARFKDECSSCREGFKLDAITLICLRVCVDAHCNSCVAKAEVCEVCMEGFHLFKETQTCAPNVSLTCPIVNCVSCVGMRCLQCEQGFEKSTTSNQDICVKMDTCKINWCKTCHPLDPLICIECEKDRILDFQNRCTFQ